MDVASLGGFTAFGSQNVVHSHAVVGDGAYLVGIGAVLLDQDDGSAGSSPGRVADGLGAREGVVGANSSGVKGDSQGGYSLL